MAALDDLRFCILQIVTAHSGSIVLALAFVAGDASPADIMAAVYAEEDYKAEIYNENEHGLAPLEEKKREAMRRELLAARNCCDLIGI